MQSDFGYSQLSSLELIRSRPHGLVVVSAAEESIDQLSDIINAPVVYSVDDKLIDDVLSGAKRLFPLKAASTFNMPALLARRGVPREILGGPDFLAGLIKQSTVPELCQQCKRPHLSLPNSVLNPHTEIRLNSVAEKYGLDIDRVFVRYRTDCAQCNDTAHNGELMVTEIVAIDDFMRSHIANGDEIAARRHWIENGGQTLLARAIEMLFSGLLDPRDVEHKFGLLTFDQILSDGVFDIKNESRFTRAMRRISIEQEMGEMAGLER